MRVIVAGGRDAQPAYELVVSAIAESGIEITELVHGAARGIDSAAGEWAERNKIPIKVFPADWSQHGRAAGPIRNRQMAEYADALIAVWDGNSRGTKNMIETAQTLELQVFVYKYPL